MLAGQGPTVPFCIERLEEILRHTELKVMVPTLPVEIPRRRRNAIDMMQPLAFPFVVPKPSSSIPETVYQRDTVLDDVRM
jgi:hypothetical protein